MVVAHSKGGVEAAACSGYGDEVVACSGDKIMDIGGGGGTVVSGATAERERAQGQNFAKCGERGCGPEILVRGTKCMMHP
jgi:hypothetical protein